MLAVCFTSNQTAVSLWVYQLSNNAAQRCTRDVYFYLIQLQNDKEAQLLRSEPSAIRLRAYWLARMLSFKRPLLSVDLSVCLSVYLSVGNFDANYLGN